MINEIELRIGNWILKKNEPYFLCGIQPVGESELIYLSNGKKEIQCDIEEIFPMPLTADILEWYGGKRYNSEWFQFTIGMCFFNISLSFDYITLTDADGHEIMLHGTDIKTVHRLQNLYFELTGKQIDDNVE